MKLKKLHITLLAFSSVISIAQNIPEGLYNHDGGTIQIHEGANLGIHTHLENDGTFDENLGFTGFYSDTETLTVYGTNRAIFNDVEVDVTENLELYTSLGTRNEFWFVNGKVITPRDETDVSLDFINYDFHIGEDNARHVDGYTSNIGNKEFIFPIGDEDKLRPMILPAQTSNSFYRGAYFYEDPNSASTFSDSFLTDETVYDLETVSEYEFWDLNGIQNTTITLTWDDESNLDLITPDLESLVVVGWSKANSRWENLGNTFYEGDMQEGRITSINFIPNLYEAITFGSLGEGLSNNFYISPNNDNINEAVVFEELDYFDKGIIKIFNRWGNIVFESDDYQNDFDGTYSEGRATFLKKKTLPTGTYFYEIKLQEGEDFDRAIKGWIYITR